MDSIAEPVTTLTIPQADGARMARAAEAKLALAKDFTITTPDECELAVEEVSAITSKLNELETRRKEITAPLDAAKKSVMDLFRGPVETLTQAKDLLRRCIGNYQQEEVRKAEERRREAEAAAAAERKRIEDEARRAEEAARAKLEEAKASDNREAALAAQAEAARLATEAEIKRETADLITAPAVQQVAAVSGLGMRKTWKGRVDDKTALIAAIAAQPALQHLLTVDESALNKYAAATEGKFKLAGVHFYEDSTPVVRRR